MTDATRREIKHWQQELQGIRTQYRRQRMTSEAYRYFRRTKLAAIALLRTSGPEHPAK